MCAVEYGSRCVFLTSKEGSQGWVPSHHDCPSPMGTSREPQIKVKALSGSRPGTRPQGSVMACWSCRYLSCSAGGGKVESRLEVNLRGYSRARGIAV
jgi:hypothetical protein